MATTKTQGQKKGGAGAGEKRYMKIVSLAPEVL